MVKSKYQNGELVLCFQGPLIYEAKIQGVTKDKDVGWQYDIHYKGWNKTWDEWVTEERLLKMNSENLLKQKNLIEEHKKREKSEKAEKSFVAKKTGGSAPVAAQKRKAAIDASIANNKIALKEADGEKTTSDEEEALESSKTKKSKPSLEATLIKKTPKPSVSADPKHKEKAVVKKVGTTKPKVAKASVTSGETNATKKNLKRHISADPSTDSAALVPKKIAKRKTSSDSAASSTVAEPRTMKNLSVIIRKSRVRLASSEDGSETDSKTPKSPVVSKTKKAPMPAKKSHKKKPAPSKSSTDTGSKSSSDKGPQKSTNKSTKKTATEKNGSVASKAGASKPPPAKVVASKKKKVNSNTKPAEATVKPAVRPIGRPTKTPVSAENVTEPRDRSDSNSSLPYGKKEVVVDVPDTLKPLLVDDWDYIGRQRKLLIIPCRYNVEDLLNDYSRAREFVTPGSATSRQFSSLGAQEVCAGLREYFNTTLGSQLLYKFERVQYADILKDQPGVPMCQLYGPVHLLRMFTKMGHMLTLAKVDKKSLDLMLVHINDFLTYMVDNMDQLFQTEDYGTATPEYHRRAL